MSTGAILTVLSNIPWGQVVENAPKVADGAARLWSSVTGRRRSAATAVPIDAATALPSDVEALRAQVQVLTQTVRSLEEQMQASSEVIKALADQNTQLVQGIELNRVRLQRIGIAGAAVVLVLAAVLVHLLWRP